MWVIGTFVVNTQWVLQAFGFMAGDKEVSGTGAFVALQGFRDSQGEK